MNEEEIEFMKTKRERVKKKDMEEQAIVGKAGAKGKPLAAV